MKTKVKLARDLKAAGAPDWMIRYAIDGHYDDYESDLATPITQLVADCERMAREHPGEYGNLRHFALKAKDGEYDGTREESEAWMKKEGLKIIEGEFKGSR